MHKCKVTGAWILSRPVIRQNASLHCSITQNQNHTRNPVLHNKGDIFSTSYHVTNIHSLMREGQGNLPKIKCKTRS